MVHTTLDFAERYLLKTEVRVAESAIDLRWDEDDWSSSDGPIVPYHHYDDLQ